MRLRTFEVTLIRAESQANRKTRRVQIQSLTATAVHNAISLCPSLSLPRPPSGAERIPFAATSNDVGFDKKVGAFCIISFYVVQSCHYKASAKSDVTLVLEPLSLFLLLFPFFSRVKATSLMAGAGVDASAFSRVKLDASASPITKGKTTKVVSRVDRLLNAVDMIQGQSV